MSGTKKSQQGGLDTVQEEEHATRRSSHKRHSVEPMEFEKRYVMPKVHSHRESDVSEDGVHQLLKSMKSNVNQMTAFAEATGRAKSNSERRDMLVGLFRNALLSGVFNQFVTLVDFLLLLHCIQVKSAKESNSDQIKGVLGFFLAWFLLSAICRVGLIKCSKQKWNPKQNDDYDEEDEDEEHKRKLREKLEPWDMIDAFLLFVCLIGTCAEGMWSSAAILPRILRAISVIFVEKLHLRFFRPLVELVQVMIHAFSSVIFSSVLLTLQHLVFAAFGMELVQVKLDEVDADRISEKFGRDVTEQCCDAFSTLVLSVSTLFSLAAGNQWDSVALPIIYVKPWTLIFFILHVLVASALLFGMLYAVLNLTLVDWKQKQVHLEEEKVLKEKMDAIVRLEELFVSMDNNRDGQLTWDEFYHNRQSNPECRRICNKLDISEDNLQWLWSVLDQDQDGRVSQKEFLELMWKVQSPENKWTLIQNNHIMKQNHQRMEQLYKTTEQGFSLVQAELRKMQLQGFAQGASPAGGKRNSQRVSVSLALSEDEEDALAIKSSPDHVASSMTLQAQQKALAIATENLRGVAADKVVYYNRNEVIDFWGSGSFIDMGVEKEFTMSHAVEQCDFFVSHCWNGPEDWYEYFKRNDHLQTYEYKKAMVAHHILTEAAPLWLQQRKKWTGEMSKSDSRLETLLMERTETMRSATSSFGNKPDKDPVAKVTLWIDKCCIPQTDKHKKALCVKLIEEFMQLSRGFIVILSWNYFTRLWCVYEWACYFRMRNFNDLRIFVGLDAFLRSSPDDTLHLYLDSIENLYVKTLQCYNQSDHQILEDKVFHYYQGESREEAFASFERFSKCTAIGFLSKQVVRFRARRSLEDQNAWMGPILALATRLKLTDLHDALSIAEPAKWFEIVDKDQESFDLIVEFWFQQILARYLALERKRAVRSKHSSSDDEGPEVTFTKSMSDKIRNWFGNKGKTLGNLRDLFQEEDKAKRTIASSPEAIRPHIRTSSRQEDISSEVPAASSSDIFLQTSSEAAPSVRLSHGTVYVPLSQTEAGRERVLQQAVDQASGVPSQKPPHHPGDQRLSNVFDNDGTPRGSIASSQSGSRRPSTDGIRRDSMFLSFEDRLLTQIRP